MKTTQKPQLNRARILELAVQLCECDNNEGICLSCGEVAEEVEPDARGYCCKACGAHKVYGAQEICLMLAFA
jgi:hypothetical protein